MTHSDAISLAGVIVSAIVGILSLGISVASIIIAVKTLKQNKKMIQNSSRPYVSVVLQATNFQNPNLYLVVKNFGNSGAIIMKLDFDIDLLKYSYKNDRRPFDKIEGTFIAPQQKIMCNIKNVKMGEDDIKAFNAHIEYTDGVHNYIEDYPLNFESLTRNITVRASTEGKELRNISYTLQDMVEKQL